MQRRLVFWTRRCLLSGFPSKFRHGVSGVVEVYADVSLCCFDVGMAENLLQVFEGHAGLVEG